MNSRFIEFLYAPRSLQDKWDWWQERVEYTLAECTSTTTHYGATGGGVGVGGAKDHSLAALADLVDRRDQTAKQRELAVNNLELLLTAMTNTDIRYGARDAALLRMRYIYGYEMKDIHHEFSTNDYTPALRTIYDWHSGAVQRAEKLWLKTKKEDEKL